MLKTFAIGTALCALALTTPAAAQEGSGEDAAAMEAISAVFGDVEPLTAEQESRIPAATLVVDKIFPAGTYAKMMAETMEPMMDSIMGSMLEMPAAEFVKLSGLPFSQVDEMGEGTVGEAMAIMDPAYAERSKRVADVTIKLVTDLMNEVEPSYREGLTRAYAVRFPEAELIELNAFFSTPTGNNYASQSLLIYTDPQVMSAMSEMMPKMMEMMPAMITGMAEATADLQEPRKYSELSADEQAKLSTILGVPQAELAASEPTDDLGEF